jgi:hypothetical protein
VGIIHHDVETGYLRERPDLKSLLRPFLVDFDVTWGASRRRFGSNISAFFLKPEQIFSEMFGIEREVLLLISEYETVEPRIMQAASAILAEAPAKGRVESLLFILLSPANNLLESVGTMVSDNAQSKIPIPFGVSETKLPPNAFFVKKRFQQHLFSRDLFDIAQPISSDQYFFGRNAIVMELRDALKNSENIGLFGLRKMGKTSLIFKLKRLVEEESLGTVVYIDLQDAALYSLRWWQLLDEIRRRLPAAGPGISANEATSARMLRTDIQGLRHKRPDQKVLIALDEIEHIAPVLRMRPHWDSDFLDFWKTLRAIQNENRHISFLVCGVNASVIETPTYNGHDNPLFSLAKVRYLASFNREELRQMIRTLGGFMGMTFSEDWYDDLLASYGGHPLLARLACSFIFKRIPQHAERPVHTTNHTFSECRQECDQSLFPFGSHILGMLTKWYPEEYKLLKELAHGNVTLFSKSITEVPKYRNHLYGYQLVQGDPPRLSIPFLRDYLIAEDAATQAMVANQGLIAGVDPTQEDFVEISRLRNRLEPKLRRFVKRVLKSHLGSERWIDAILAVVPTQDQKKLQGVDKDIILGERIYLSTLITVIDQNWKYFCHLESSPPDKRVTKDQVKVLLEYVNAQRKDAHAKPINESELAALKLAVWAVERAIERYLED